MSVNTIENALFELQSNPALLERFAREPGAVLEPFPLTPQERAELLAWNVRALNERGVSGMLLMVAYTAVHGQHGMPDYLRRMNAPAAA